MSERIQQRIEDGTATIAVVGLGYVGLPLAIACARAGFRTIGLDLDEDKVNGVRNGKSHITDIDDSEVERLIQSGTLGATTSYANIAETDVVLISVPTPLNKTKDPDLSMVVGAMKAVAEVLGKQQLVVLESTTYPGFTREVGLPLLEESGLTCGEDFFLAFSPERTDPGNVEYHVTNTTKILGGLTDSCAVIARRLYEKIIDDVHVVSSTDAAEMVKLLENTFRAVNIGLVNEVAIMCHHLNIDVWEVIEAAKTKPFGFMPFYPGPGLGGHCIPVDPLYLSWKLRSHNYTARFIELAQTVNAAMPQFVVSLVQDALNDHHKAVRGSRVILLGVSYKRDTIDIRESPALEIVGLLARKGANVGYCDPAIPTITVEETRYSSIEINEALETADAIVITTDHSHFDWKAVVDRATTIVDTRNATRRIELSPEQKKKVYLL